MAVVITAAVTIVVAAGALVQALRLERCSAAPSLRRAITARATTLMSSGPAYVVGGSDDAYCSRRYRSYDPASGTYLGYDGYRHPCP